MSKSARLSRIAVKHVNVMDQVRPAPSVNPALVAALFAAFGAQPFVVRRVK